MADNRPPVNNNNRNTAPNMNMRMGRGPRWLFNEKPKDKKGAFKRLLKYLIDSRGLLIALLFVMVFITAASVASPVVQGKVLDAVDQGDENLFITLLFALGACYVLNIIAMLFRGLLSAYLAQRTVLKMRRDLFNKLIYLPIAYYDSHPHGDIMSRMTNDVDSISSTISQSVASFISTFLIIIGAFTIMLLFSPLLALVSTVSIFLSFFASRFMSKRMRKYFKMQQEMLGEINSKVEESITGQRTVSAYTKEDDLETDFNATSNHLEGIAIRAQAWGGAMGPIMNIIGNLGFLLIVASGAIFYNLGIGAGVFGPISIGTIIIFTNCSKQINRPINEVAQLYAQIETSLAAAERVFVVMDSEPEIDTGTVELPEDFQVETIEFNHVNFSYVPGEQVLKDFNLKIHKGEKIALVGATGSGKTTVVNLLMRFYDIDSGEILINGIDIRELPKETLRQMVSIVLQDTVLFTDTISNNIKYGKEAATSQELEFYSEFANVDKFVRHLPDGYETLLANSGANLSQGQRQLLTIARAAITEPKILVLDEATSSVDTRTEKAIQDAMVNLMKDRTSLIIAHRLSTIRDADQIVVIHHGEVVEIGNHDQLIEEGGRYYELYMTQFAGNAI